jgi:hypothetical protein
MESNALENWSSTLQLWKIGVQRFSFGELESNALALEIGVQRFSFGQLEFNELAFENWSPKLQLWAFFVFWNQCNVLVGKKTGATPYQS